MRPNSLPSARNMTKSSSPSFEARLTDVFCPFLDSREREIGERFSSCAKAALAGHMLVPFTEKLGMSVEDVNALVGRAQIEVDDIGLKPYLGL